ncbi:MAG: hypothetical protein EHM70_17185 [Chloroflexota bacterium]|nr:MAG: hypothetical protein EHM70_17185 [Chloroflexota bacterium]
MLQKMLDYIKSHGIASPAELARQLDASPELVEQMLEHLARSGYLRQVKACPSGGCSHGCQVNTGSCGYTRTLKH